MHEYVIETFADVFPKFQLHDCCETFTNCFDTERSPEFTRWPFYLKIYPVILRTQLGLRHGGSVERTGDPWKPPSPPGNWHGGKTPPAPTSLNDPNCDWKHPWSDSDSVGWSPERLLPVKDNDPARNEELPAPLEHPRKPLVKAVGITLSSLTREMKVVDISWSRHNDTMVWQAAIRPATRWRCPPEAKPPASVISRSCPGWAGKSLSVCLLRPRDASSPERGQGRISLDWW